MVKFFGWESKMSAEVAKKRKIELVCLWKRKVLDLVNGCLKWVVSHSVDKFLTLSEASSFQL
jgi:hypothetical protein